MIRGSRAKYLDSLVSATRIIFSCDRSFLGNLASVFRIVDRPARNLCRAQGHIILLIYQRFAYADIKNDIRFYRLLTKTGEQNRALLGLHFSLKFVI